MRASLLLLALSALTTATPLPGLRTPSLPTTDGPEQLPPPSAGLTLKRVTLGRGTQNYTCAATDPSAPPTQVGAVATLFDITPLASLPLLSPLLASLPALAVNLPLPLPQGPGAGGIRYPGAGTGGYLVAGTHYFAADGTPVFELDRAAGGGRKVLYAKKAAGVPAPKAASRGPSGSGAVAWLKLEDKGGSVGLKEVYR
jgi:hypothetical protein